MGTTVYRHYKITNRRTGKFVRFNCIADVLSFLDSAGHKCYNVRGLMRVLNSGHEYNAGPLTVRRIDNLKDRW